MVSKQLKELCKEHLDLFYSHSHSHRDYEKEVSLLLSKVRLKYRDIKTERWEELVDLLRDKPEILWLLLRLEKSTTESIGDKTKTIISLGQMELPSWPIKDLKNQDWATDYSDRFEHSPGCRETVSTVDSAYQSDHSDESLHISQRFSAKASTRKKEILSWEKFKDTDIKSPFLTEGGYQAFQVAYLDFRKTPLEVSSDMPFISMNQLLSKLILLCNGIPSDLFLYQNGGFQAACTFRSGGIGSVAMKNILLPFLEHGNRIKHLQTLVVQLESTPYDVGLAGIALASSLTGIIKSIYSQTASLTDFIRKNELSVLQLQYYVAGIFDVSLRLHFFVEHNIKPNLNKRMYLVNLVYDKLLEAETLMSDIRFRAVLTELLQSMLKPFFQWMDAWLRITGSKKCPWEIQSFSDFDPYNEFFIQQSDDGDLVFVDSVQLPWFLNRKFAMEIFECGKINRQFANLDSLATRHLNSIFLIESRWVIDVKSLEYYRNNIDSFCNSQLNSRKTAFMEAEMARIEEFEKAHQKHLETISKQEHMQLEKSLLAIDKESTIAKSKLELKQNIEVSPI
jgi:hypothetical protein